MKPPPTRDFTIHAGKDRIRVHFVGRKELGRMASGHSVGGDYSSKIIRLPRFETQKSNAFVLAHELGHYCIEHDEMRGRAHGSLADGTTEEEVCDLFGWWPYLLNDPRNDRLREFILDLEEYEQ